MHFKADLWSASVFISLPLSLCTEKDCGNFNQRISNTDVLVRHPQTSQHCDVEEKVMGWKSGLKK